MAQPTIERPPSVKLAATLPEECPACGREAVLVWTRTDWPEPETPESDYVLVCRSCLASFRRLTLSCREHEALMRRATFGTMYYSRVAARRWIKAGCP